jgi:competence protein ComEC
MILNRGIRRRVAIVILLVTVGSSVVWTVGSAGHAIASVPVNWRIAACDVGQGDAVLLRGARADGAVETALIDTGRSPEVMRACLTRLDISRVNVLVLTHYDLDHVGGAAALLGKVDRVILGKPENSRDQALAADLCREKTICDIGRAGMTGALGNASWQVVWPDGVTPDMQSGNPGSISMIVRWPDLSAAFVADLGAQAQEILLDSTLDIPAVDVLKVAHHGSADTSERLVTRFHPKIALISVGKENGYGHPTRKALSMLEGLGTVVGRTDRQGFLFVVREAGSLRLDTDR